MPKEQSEPEPREDAEAKAENDRREIPIGKPQWKFDVLHVLLLLFVKVYENQSLPEPWNLYESLLRLIKHQEVDM